jgi:hypothetical protein
MRKKRKSFRSSFLPVKAFIDAIEETLVVLLVGSKSLLDQALALSLPQLSDIHRRRQLLNITASLRSRRL